MKDSILDKNQLVSILQNEVSNINIVFFKNIVNLKLNEITRKSEELIELEKEKENIEEIKSVYKQFTNIIDKIDFEIKRKENSNDKNLISYLNKSKQQLNNLLKPNNSLETIKNSILNVEENIARIKSILGSKNTIFILGENGSGKTTFLKQLSSENLSNFTYIPAIKNIEKRKDITRIPSINMTNDFTFNSIFWEQNMLGIMKNTVMEILEGVKTKISNVDYDKNIEVIKILWKDIFNGKHVLEINNRQAYINNNNSYSIEEASDGEYFIFFYLLLGMFSEKNAYIAIDEVDNHLNIRQIKKLFEGIMIYRKDLKFIFTTHSYEFVNNFQDKSVYWCENKEVIGVEEDFFIKNPKYCNLLYGNSEKLLVCEGENTDEQFYRLIFKDYNVISARSCKDVEETVKVLKERSMKNIVGIIDRDYLGEEEINKKKRKDIFVLPYRHIENLLASEFIFTKMCIKNPSYNAYTEKYEKLKTDINIGDKEIISDYHKDMIEKMENLITGCKTLSDISELSIPQVEPMKQPTTYDEFLQRYKPKGQCNKIKPGYKDEVIATLKICEDFCEDIRNEFFSQVK